MTSAAASAASASPRASSVGSRVKRWSLSASCGSTHVRRAPRCRARALRRPPRPASSVSAATTAIGWPAYCGSAGEQRRRASCSESSLSGPITARTPGVARAASRSSERDAAVRDGRAQHGRVQHSRRAVRRPCSARGPAARAARPGAAPGWPTSASSASAGPALDVVRLVDERPDVLVAPLHLRLRRTRRAIRPPPAARRIARSIFG